MQNEGIIEILKEAMVRGQMDNPINWLKWAACIAVLIITYIVAFKIYCKVEYFIGREKKRDKARALNHVMQGKLVKSWVSRKDDSNNRYTAYTCHATYEYEINGKIKKYHAMFDNTKTAPRILHLYYINNPNRVFAVDDYHWDAPKGLILAPIIFLPWICAALTAILVKIPGIPV